MKIIEGPGPRRVDVVCCPHGDELIGEAVFNHYQSQIETTPGLRLIFANAAAHERGTRFVDADLNRSFPGSPGGNHEQRLAHQLKSLIHDTSYVLDLHTTTSDIVMTPIVAHLGPNVRQILNLTSSREVALMSPTIAKHSLIGNISHGVSLEFNRDVADTPAALTQITTLIEGLLRHADRPAAPRQIFRIEGTIPLNATLPRAARNFHLLPKLQYYPFLLHEKAYADSMQGFYAKRVTTEQI